MSEPSLSPHAPCTADILSSRSQLILGQLLCSIGPRCHPIMESGRVGKYISRVGSVSCLAIVDRAERLSRSGVLVLGSSSDISIDNYATKYYENDVVIGSRLHALKDGEAIRSVFPKGVNVASFEKSSGYLNLDGGWANAAQGIQFMTARVVAFGGKVIPGKSVVKLLRENGRTSGVQFSDGTTYDATLVVLATGSWTASSFPDLDFTGKCIATG